MHKKERIYLIRSFLCAKTHKIKSKVKLSQNFNINSKSPLNKGGLGVVPPNLPNKSMKCEAAIYLLDIIWLTDTNNLTILVSTNKKLMGNIYQLAPKNLQEHLDALTIFSEQMNKRPSHDLWYSEKLITINQKHDYENAIKAFQDFINRIEASQIPKNGQTDAFKT